MYSRKSRNFSNEITNLALTLFEKTDDRITDGIEKYIVHRYPKEIEKFKIRNQREGRLASAKEKLDKLYDENKRILFHKKANKPQNQEKYVFSQEFQKIFFKGIEVSCRMITSTINNNTNRTEYNLSRVADIKFKGDVQNMIDKLLEKCKEELETKHDTKVINIHSTAIYVRNHSLLNCPLPCNIIKRKCYNRHKHIYQAVEKKRERERDENKSDEICFGNRQLLGQSLIPYLAEESSTNEEDIMNNNVYVFDNMFLDQNCRLKGIERLHIREDGPNFLDTVDNLSCNALISFNLSSIGVTQSGMNLYLDTSIYPIYCTKANNQNEITEHASQYLEDLCFSKDKLKTLIKDKKGIDLFAIEEDFIDIDEPKTKRLKIEDEEEKLSEKYDEENTNLEDEDDDKERNEEYEENEEENEEENDLVYETRRKQMIQEI